MIQASKLSELFRNATDNGIDFVFFKDLTGDILWMEGKDTNKILTDVLSSMWMQYKEVQDKFIKENLTYMIIENDTIPPLPRMRSTTTASCSMSREADASTRLSTCWTSTSKNTPLRPAFRR